MKCPYCGNSDSKVIDKRESGLNQETTRRRRECLKCGKRFTTYEAVEKIEITIVKKDGSRELFDRNKVLVGVAKACEKRPITRDQIEKIVDEIKGELSAMGETELNSTIIGEQIMEKLKGIDKVAYIRFASVYRDFADLNEFEKELKKLLRMK
ncbi:MAG: transcriptional regulator NrdR [Nanoarchaeota archaeon]